MLISKNISIGLWGLLCLTSKIVAKPNKNQRVIKTKTKAKKLFLILSPRVFVPNKSTQEPNKISDDSQAPISKGIKTIAGIM